MTSYESIDGQGTQQSQIAKHVQRKLLLHVASIVGLLYFFFAIDRGNVGFAALQMNEALGLSAEVFGFGSGLFTLAYLLFQVPNAELLRRLGPSRGFAAIACAWGLASTSTAFVSDQTWFLVNRFALGVAEAGFHAFLIYYINHMFPQQARAFAIGVTFIAVPISMIVASPLSGVLLNVEIGGMAGWQSLFLLEGVPSVVLGLLCLKLIPNGPSDARFLTMQEREWLRQELQRATPSKHSSAGTGGLLQILTSPLVWGLGFILFTMVLAINVMMIWMPQIIRHVSGAGNVAVGILNSLPWIAFSAGCLVFSKLSDKSRSRIVILRWCVGVATIGFLFAAALQDSNPEVAFGGFLVAGFGAGGAQVVFWALTMQMMPGPSAATAYAVITVIGNGSGVFAHPLIGRLHDTTGSFNGVVWMLAGFYVAALVTLQLISHHDSKRERAAGLASPSMRDAPSK